MSEDKRYIVSIRNAFFTGLFILLPLAVTIIVVNFLLDKVGSPTADRVFELLDPNWQKIPGVRTGLRVVSLLLVFSFLTLLGYLSRYLLGKALIRFTERLLSNVPFVNKVYETVKQIVDTFGKDNKAVFKEVVMVEFPRKGVYAIGFLTGDSKGEAQYISKDHLVNIFIPTTPNPTSGFLVLFPKQEIKSLQMTIGEGMKLIVSGGAVVPPFDENQNPVTLNNPIETPISSS
tara:strand:+ start:184 stop:879 length:696 start_codon:yes stop_codon:yes gene_type:complete